MLNSLVHFYCPLTFKTILYYYFFNKFMLNFKFLLLFKKIQPFRTKYKKNRISFISRKYVKKITHLHQNLIITNSDKQRHYNFFHNYFNTYGYSFSNAFFYLTGNLISPFFWDLKKHHILDFQNSTNVFNTFKNKKFFKKFFKSFYLLNSNFFLSVKKSAFKRESQMLPYSFINNKNEKRKKTFFFLKFIYNYKFFFSKKITNILNKRFFNKKIKKKIKKKNYFKTTLFTFKNLNTKNFFKTYFFKTPLVSILKTNKRVLRYKFFHKKKQLTLSHNIFKIKNNIQSRSNFIVSTFKLARKHGPSSPISNKFKTKVNSNQIKTSFILSSSAHLFQAQFNYTKKKNFDWMFKMKKKYFSFNFKTDILNFILKKYSKISTASIFFGKKSHPLKTINLEKLKSKIFSFKSNSEINYNVKRIRFKPGYIKYWIKARDTFKFLNNLNFRYQHRLTNYLQRYNYFFKIQSETAFEFQLLSILIKSRLAFDKFTGESFISANYVFVNGCGCIKNNFLLNIGDFVQLVISLKFYIIYKWLLHLSFKKKIKLKKILWKKNISKSRKNDKQRSFTISDRIIFYKDIQNDIPKYLELDFLTLSFFIIFNLNSPENYNNYDLLTKRLHLVKMYNWKYIT